MHRYFLFLTLEKKVARATTTIALCGIKFLFQNTFQRNWTWFKLLRPSRENKLPVVLSREEVQKILPGVRMACESGYRKRSAMRRHGLRIETQTRPAHSLQQKLGLFSFEA